MGKGGAVATPSPFSKGGAIPSCLFSEQLSTRSVNIQSPLLFDTLIPAFSRGEKEMLRGSLNIYHAATVMRITGINIHG